MEREEDVWDGYFECNKNESLEITRFLLCQSLQRFLSTSWMFPNFFLLIPMMLGKKKN